MDSDSPPPVSKTKKFSQRLRKFFQYLWALLLKLPTFIISVLDWVVGVAERLMVLAIAFVISYGGYLLLSSSHRSEKTLQAPLAEILKDLSDNWKALLLILIPLFYRPVRTFLERVERFMGMETGPREKRSAETSKGE